MIKAETEKVKVSVKNQKNFFSALSPLYSIENQFLYMRGYRAQGGQEGWITGVITKKVVQIFGPNKKLS